MVTEGLKLIYFDTTVEVTDNGELYQEKLVKEYAKAKKVEKLAKKTFTKRQQWIVKNVPAAIEILIQFPMFKDPQYVVRKCVRTY